MNGARLGIAPSGTPALSDFMAVNAKIAPRAADIICFPQAFPTSEPMLYASQYTIASQLGVTPLAYAEPAGQFNAFTTGTYDSTIDSSAAAAVGYGKEILLVLGDEFNGSWTTYGYSNETAAQFISGFQYVVNRLRVTNGATNIKIVWAPNIWLASNAVDPTTYYPGDEYVDYIALDGFVANNGGAGFDPSTFFLSYYNSLCAITTKPFMFASIGCGDFAGEWATNNLVTNGSFEAFDSANQPHGWTVTGVATALTQSGSMGAKANIDGSFCISMNKFTGIVSISQTLNIEPSTNYHLSWWYYSAAAANQPYTVQLVGGAQDGYYLQSDNTWGASNPSLTYAAPATTVTQQIIVLTTPADATGLTITLGNSSGATLWMDSVALTDTWTSSYKQWWYQQLFSLINASMPRVSGICMWTQSGSDGDYTLDSSGTDSLSLAAFKSGATAFPFVWERAGFVAI